MVKGLRGIFGREASEPAPAPARQPERCLSCGANLEGSRLYERFRVCHSCGFHFHLTAQERLATLLDAGSFHEDDRGVSAIDPLSFQGRQSYRSRVVQEQRRTRLTEAALTGTGWIGGREVVIGVIDFAFLGGSIGVAAGERLARAFEKAAARRVPVVLVCSTSGTRMQEGLLALMQGPRIAVAAGRHARAGLPYIAVLTDPTTGSAYSGFINLADVLIAEPNALVGYAALRALQETTKNGLPEGAHTSEAHLQRGLVDAVVSRPNLRETLAGLLDLLTGGGAVERGRPGKEGRVVHTPRPAWQQVQLSRHAQRPTARDFIERMTSGFFELRGDRTGSDDPAVVAGIGSLSGEAVVLVGQVRPHTNDQAGVIGPAGFRKAERAFRLASKLGLPVVTLVDTAGADPSLGAEEAGQGAAIARCMQAMLATASPTVAVITGEGNSEAAMAMAVADRVLMLDNAVYEVIRPEDAAAILEGGEAGAPDVAERLRLTSHDCLRLGIVDHTVPEPGEGAHTDHAAAAALLRRAVLRELARLRRKRGSRRLEERYSRYRELGSTRSWLRGRIERRLAHLQDRMGSWFDRLRGRAFRRRADYPDDAGIPV
ncbi:carboxyl transferase domain-containing protein [Tepidiforma sp.]|uniref:carboxyl transferase domain-containing protein n=1 Tax=Tepidiforma sp. TaxID=2682230 RepID=UPI002ADE55F0|nr:carboxyl transferase domain-containing protein [Tepidiforma sp.]